MLYAAEKLPISATAAFCVFVFEVQNTTRRRRRWWDSELNSAARSPTVSHLFCTLLWQQLLAFSSVERLSEPRSISRPKSERACVRACSSYCHPSISIPSEIVAQQWHRNGWKINKQCRNCIFSSCISVMERLFDKSLPTFMLLALKKKRQGSSIAKWNFP